MEKRKPCNYCPLRNKCYARPRNVSSYSNCRVYAILEFEENCKDPYFNYSSGCANPIEPEPCCGFCTEYDGSRCMKRWNNLDECYYNPDLDDKEPEDWCEDYKWNGEDEFE